MEIDVLANTLVPLNVQAKQEAQRHFDSLIKPVGSLAKLELWVTQYAGICGSAAKADLQASPKALFLWTADAERAVHYMSNVNAAACLAEEVQASTQTFLVSSDAMEEALLEGALLVKEYVEVHQVRFLAIGDVDHVRHKPVWQRYEQLTALELLDALADPTLAAMAGAIIQAAALKLPVMLDGVNTCLAAWVAVKLNPTVRDYLMAGQSSGEPGSEELLRLLGLEASLKLDIIAANGEGAALAMGLFDAGLKAYKEMETFAEAGVHAEVKEFAHSAQSK